MEHNSHQLKTFVIDTNVFIHKPDAIMSFRENEVVIPLWVLEELDKLKSHSDERGRNARHAIRFIDSIGKGLDLRDGVKMDNGSMLYVMFTHDTTDIIDLDKAKIDNKILLSAYTLQNSGKRVFFVSKDINARIKAAALGIKAVDYEKQKVNFNKLYSGYASTEGSQDDLKTLKYEGSIESKMTLAANQFVILKDHNSSERCIAQYNAKDDRLNYVEPGLGNVCGVHPLNEEQRMALDLLLNDDLSLVTLIGKAGTGKTLLAIASGLHMVLEAKKYNRVLVSRPVVPLGKDIGYLPGGKEEKLSNWMQPIFDNIEYIISVYKKQNMKSVDQLLHTKSIEIEALTYIRGRSLPNQFIVIDEAQNLTPHEIKTIVSRAGEGTKVVLTGDPYQIDSPYLDANSNGLTYLIETFKQQNIFGHMTLNKSERSPLAELAAELL